MSHRDELSPGAHRREIARHGGHAAAAFAYLVGDCLRRWAAQNGLDPFPASLVEEFAASLWSVVTETGLPEPLPEGESGEPGEMGVYDVAVLGTRVFEGILEHRERHGDLETPVRQLLKACLQPEFRRCRESYREVVEGVCRRQELGKARSRISGSHCVDCPYWIAFRPEPHAGFLARAWNSGNAADFEGHRGIFLPEDFRALRIFVWRHARTD